MRRAYRFVALALLGFMVVAGVAAAQASRVRFNQENHFVCYIVSEQTPQPAETVTLEDQFTREPVPVNVGEPLQFCASAEKTHDGEVFPIEAEEEHLVMYPAPRPLEQHLLVETEDQFGPRTLEVVSARYLLVPTQKTFNGVTEPNPDDLNHYWCYEANGKRVGERVTLDDQFTSSPRSVRVETPRLFCNPAEKVHESVGRFPIEERGVHLTCYEIRGRQATVPTEIGVSNQFETDTYMITAFELLCAPAEKHSFTPIP